MFISAVVGLLDITQRKFTYSNAGHCYPLLFDSDGECSNLDIGGCLLGIEPAIDYHTATIDLPAGSTLFLYTDGIPDMIDKDENDFGTDRLIESLKKCLDLPAAEIGHTILEAVNEHCGEINQFDDCTLIVIKSL